MCSVIKNVNKSELIKTFMSDVIHCFALKIKMFGFMTQFEFYKILRHRIKKNKEKKKKLN